LFLCYSGEQDQAILQALTSPQKLRKFHKVCDDNTLVFGKPRSKERRQAQNRWYYLQTLRQENFQRFTDLCHSQGIIVDIQDNETELHISRTLEATTMSRHSLRTKRWLTTMKRIWMSSSLT
jgi:hypothetical protein